MSKEKWKSEEYECCLTFDQITYNVRGSGYNWHETISGKQRYMTQKSMEELLTTSLLTKGRVYGVWKTYKRGQVVSSKLVEQFALPCSKCSNKILCGLKGDNIE